MDIIGYYQVGRGVGRAALLDNIDRFTIKDISIEDIRACYKENFYLQKIEGNKYYFLRNKNWLLNKIILKYK